MGRIDARGPRERRTCPSPDRGICDTASRMTSRGRRENEGVEASLTAIAHAAPDTGRGFAASKGVRLERALSTGSTITVGGRFDPTDCCTAESFCDQRRRPGSSWCERHAARAESIGAAVPAPL